MADDPTADDLSNTSNNLSGREGNFAIPEDQSDSIKRMLRKEGNHILVAEQKIRRQNIATAEESTKSIRKEER